MVLGLDLERLVAKNSKKKIMKADISFLFECPTLDKQALLTIEPLAPLSIVSSLPGSYYKSLDKPTKANLCGIFENVLGWHIGQNERKAILKRIVTVYKKEYQISDFEIEKSLVGYTSLLGHLFRIDLLFTPTIVLRYDDLWTQHLKDKDVRHLKGTPNLNYPLIKEKQRLPTDEKGKVVDDTYTKFIKENNSGFPIYYSSPTPREFIVLEGNYEIKVSINNSLLKRLKEALGYNNSAYLGTNEGWIDLSILEI